MFDRDVGDARRADHWVDIEAHHLLVPARVLLTHVVWIPAVQIAARPFLGEVFERGCPGARNFRGLAPDDGVCSLGCRGKRLVGLGFASFLEKDPDLVRYGD
ncbi:MAG TPA: hypothetical protein VGY54_00600 [Polyangiaceae bacterium]|nr:hypothetical protein [Polyangiaceae bacterium]